MQVLFNLLIKAGLIVEGSADFQGVSTAITQIETDSSKKIATTEFVALKISSTSISQLSDVSALNPSYGDVLMYDGAWFATGRFVRSESPVISSVPYFTSVGGGEQTIDGTNMTYDDGGGFLVTGPDDELAFRSVSGGTGIGLQGESELYYGVYGISYTGAGVAGKSTSGPGLRAISTSGIIQDWYSGVNEIAKVSTEGGFLIGKPNYDGYRLDVNGSGRFNNFLTVEKNTTTNNTSLFRIKSGENGAGNIFDIQYYKDAALVNIGYYGNTGNRVVINGGSDNIAPSIELFEKIGTTNPVSNVKISSNSSATLYDGYSYFYAGNFLIGTKTNSIYKLDVVGGPVRFSGLSGLGTRMVVAGANGELSTQDISSASGTVSSVGFSITSNNGDVSYTLTNPTTTPAIVLNIPTASSTSRGVLTSANWTTFNNKQATLVNGVNIKTLGGLSLLGSGDLGFSNTTTGSTFVFETYSLGFGIQGINLNIPIASTTLSGLLTSTDWTMFNNKQDFLVSGTNIKTINGTSLLGSGNITVSSGSGLTSLNTLTASTQTFSVGSSGTDFTISSATSTHTFNIPSASATNRGLLTAADFIAFSAKQNAITNPVTGTGTINYIPKWTSSSAIGNSLIFDNGTNVGIGTATPSQKLDVAGNISANLVIALNDFYGTNLRVNGFFANTITYMPFYSNVTPFGEIMRVQNDGNVLIGTQVTNGYKLQVNGPASFTSSIPGSASVSVGSSSNQPLLSFNNAGTATVASIGANGGSQELFNIVSRINGGSINFYTNTSTQIAKLWDDGNFTLQNAGTYSNDGYRLDVKGVSRFNDTLLIHKTTDAIFRLRGGTYNGIYDTTLRAMSGAQGILQLGNNDINYIIAGNNTTGGYLSFRVNATGENVTSGTEAMRVTAAGNLLIGSDQSTGSKLYVNGGVSIGSYQTYDSNYSLHVFGSTKVESALDVIGHIVSNTYIETGNYSTQTGGQLRVWSGTSVPMDIHANPSILYTGTLSSASYFLPINVNGSLYYMELFSPP